MNKNIIIISLVSIFLAIVFVIIINKLDDKYSKNSLPMLPYIGQKVWTYNMNDRSWHNYTSKDEEELKDNIVLQYQETGDNGNNSVYHMITTNIQVPKEEVWLGESSREFLSEGRLLSYYPKNFEFHEIKFNGVSFVSQKLSKSQIEEIFPGYTVVSLSDISKKTDFSISKTGKKYIIINDKGDNFYKYFIIPNDSKNLQLGDFSNQFEIKNRIIINIQRLEGCSKSYPCYKFDIK